MKRAWALILLGAIAVGCDSRPQPLAAATLGRLRAVQEMLREYQQACAGYPGALAAVGEPEPGAIASCAGLGLTRDRREGSLQQVVSAETGVVLDGYRWEYRPAGAPAGVSPARFSGYQLRATWVGKEEPRHSFYSDQTGVIRVATHGPAGAGDPELR